jgi:hypothetical protein
MLDERRVMLLIDLSRRLAVGIAALVVIVVCAVLAAAIADASRVA